MQSLIDGLEKLRDDLEEARLAEQNEAWKLHYRGIITRLDELRCRTMDLLFLD